MHKVLPNNRKQLIVQMLSDDIVCSSHRHKRKYSVNETMQQTAAGIVWTSHCKRETIAIHIFALLMETWIYMGSVDMENIFLKAK